jgi:hypothetical protein
MTANVTCHLRETMNDDASRSAAGQFGMFQTKREFLVASLLAAIAGPAVAQQPTPPSIDVLPSSQQLGPAESYFFAQRLYSFGVANSDVLSAIAAAGILAKVQPSDVPSPNPSTALGPGADTVSVAKLASLDDMLATARKLAGQNRTLLALIADVVSGVGRGVTGGAKRWTDNVQPGKAWSYTYQFDGDRPAEIKVVTAPGLPLVILIRDEMGNEICRAEQAETIKNEGRAVQVFSCDWQPIWTGKFDIVVNNSFTRVAEYEVFTN